MARLLTACPPLAGASTETEGPRRSVRLLQAAARSRDAPPPPPPAAKRPKTIDEGSAEPYQIECRKPPKTIEEGSADDAGAEFNGLAVFGLTREEVRPYFMRLFKKRANMALGFYHKNNPGDLYEFVEVRKEDVYDFKDRRISYLHMNFKAKNVTTGSEKLFFAELALEGYVFDMYGGYCTTCCSIVDENCVGGQNHMVYFKEDLPEDGYDENHCYVCDETIKHPIGSSYKAGHCGWGYFLK